MKPGSGSSAIGPSAGVVRVTPASTQSMIRGTGSSGRPYAGISSRLVEASKSAERANALPSGKTWKVGNFTIRKISSKRVGRGVSTEAYEITDGVERTTAYSLDSAKKQAEYMTSVPKSQRDAERDALLEKLFRK